MTDKTKNLKGNGNISVSNVNSMSSECITLTYTIWNFKNKNQVSKIKKDIEDLVDSEVAFDLGIQDYSGLEEKYKLKVKVKACEKEKLAHTIKEEIDNYIKEAGGQTTLDESLGGSS